MVFSTGKFSFFVLVLLLVSLSSISALSQDGSGRDALKLILGENNLGPFKNGINEDVVAQGPDIHEPLLLAANRTKRPDILDHFKRYRGGWDITNKHYWASVGFTGAAAFILAVIWFILFGLVLVVHHCCGWRINIKGKGTDLSQRIYLILLILFTCVSA